MLIAVVVTASLRIARRPATLWLQVFLPIVVCAMTTILYLPLAGANDRRIDRIAGPVEEPVSQVRALALSVAATLALAVLFLAITRRCHTPADARQTALAVPMIVCSVLLSVYFLFVLMPMTNGWLPADWRRRDRLVPFRPCRGAILWEDADHLYAIARVDNIWLQFADPRKGGERIDRAEAAQFKVHSDDPAVIRCDSHPRREPVAPAEWHRVGAQ